MKNKIIVGLIAIAVVGLAVFFAGCIEEMVGEPKLIIASLTVEYDSRGSTIDDIKIEFVDIVIKNLGDASFGSSIHPQKLYIDVVVNNQNNSVYTYAYIKPNETRRPATAYLESEDLSLEVERQPREYEIEGILYIKDESGEIIDSRNFSVLIPTAKVGDTILLSTGRLARDGEPKRFDITFNSRRVEPNELSPEKYKDVILKVTIKNSYHRMEVETPKIFASVMSDKRYVEYGDLSPLSYEELYPEEEITGEIKVTIPIDWNPVEICISYTDEIILLS